MKVIMLIPDIDMDYNFFDTEIKKILNIYSNNWKSFQFILPDCNSSFVAKEWCKNNDLDYLNFGLNDKSYLNCIEAMVHYAKDEYSLLINFEDNYQITKRKANLFKKITKDIEIYIVLFDRFVEEIKCCDQDLYWLDEIEEEVNVYFCEACQTHYLIHDEIIDTYIAMNMKFETLRKIRFLKGEFKDGK